jgi:futalosine hydrolase
MHILLAAATTVEIQPTIDFLLKRRIDPIAALRTDPSASATTGTASDTHLTSTLITGVGSLPTTWSLTRQIDRERPNLIIQAGIAGCFTGRSPGEVLAIRDETLADLGVWEDHQFKTTFDLQLADPNQPPFTAGRLVNPYPTLLTFTRLETVSAITVNEISTNPDRIDWYRTRTGAAVESMEGGALHYVGLRERTAFLQLRSVSNQIGTRDKSKWNIPLAIQRLNEELIRLLKELDHNDTTILNAVNNAT